MATRRNVDESLLDQAGNVIVPGSFPEPSPELEESNAEMALISVLEQLGGEDEGAKVMVYRITDDRRKPDAFLRKFTCEEFARDGLETLQRIYGGGLYKISVYGSDGRLKKNPVINIEVPAGFKPEGVQSAQPDNTAALLGVMQSGFQKMGEMLAASFAQLNNRPQESRTDFLREIVTMKELFAPQSAGGEASAIEMLMKGLELGKSLTPRGEAGENDLLMGLMENFGKPIVEMAMSKQAQESQVPPQSAVTANFPVPQNQPPISQSPQPQTAASPVQNNSLTENTMSNNFVVKQALNFLISQAARDNDPYTYANMVLDQVDENTIEVFFAAPNWFEKICEINPSAARHRDWFERLKVEIMTLLTAEFEPDIQTGTEPVGTSSASNLKPGTAPSNSHDDSLGKGGNHPNS